MRRAFALHSKIARRRDDTASEMLLPETIHHNASGKRMIGSREPIGKLSPAPRGRIAVANVRERICFGVSGTQEFWKSWLHLIFGPFAITTFQQMGRRRRAPDIVGGHGRGQRI